MQHSAVLLPASCQQAVLWAVLLLLRGAVHVRRTSHWSGSGSLHNRCSAGPLDRLHSRREPHHLSRRVGVQRLHQTPARRNKTCCSQSWAVGVVSAISTLFFGRTWSAQEWAPSQVCPKLSVEAQEISAAERFEWEVFPAIATRPSSTATPSPAASAASYAAIVRRAASTSRASGP